MVQRLSSFAARLVADPVSLRASLKFPLVLWEVGGEQAAPVEPWGATEAGRRMNVPRRGEPLVFEVRKGDQSQNVFPGGITVGRTSRNDIPLEDPSVSRFHAYFRQDARSQNWMLVDAESSNGTWVGPLKLAPGGAAMLQDKVKLTFGAVEARFLTPASFVQYLVEASNAG